MPRTPPATGEETVLPRGEAQAPPLPGPLATSLKKTRTRRDITGRAADQAKRAGVERLAAVGRHWRNGDPGLGDRALYLVCGLGSRTGGVALSVTLEYNPVHQLE